MIKNILVGHGGADWSDDAFHFALDMAKKYKARLIVISVVSLPSVLDEEETQALIESGRARLKAVHERLLKTAQAAGVRLERYVAVGHPAEQIVDRAQADKVDLVILGHHKRKALGKWLLGGTADRVMDHASCSVIVVKGKVAK